VLIQFYLKDLASEDSSGDTSIWHVVWLTINVSKMMQKGSSINIGIKVGEVGLKWGM
jgi:hypothetical protein